MNENITVGYRVHIINSTHVQECFGAVKFILPPKTNLQDFELYPFFDETD